MAHDTPDPDGRAHPAEGPPTATFDRRRLMQLMAASLALAVGGCHPGSRFGAPLWSRPVSRAAWAEGEPVSYATTLTLDGIGRGVLVETVADRPVKIEGNPAHPASLGASDAFMQAEILSLYDPERSRSPQERGRPRSWVQARAMLTALGQAVGGREGRGLHIVTAPTGSPTVARLMREMQSRWPASRVHLHAAIDDDQARAGALLAFGRDVSSIVEVNEADTIVCLGADILGPGPLQMRNAADYAARRRRGRETNRLPRLIVAETSPTLTGARADTRLALAPAEIEHLAFDIAAGLGVIPGDVPGGAASRAEPLVSALRASGPASVVIAGRDQPAVVHAIAHAINVWSGAVGRTVRHVEPVLPLPEGAQSLRELTAAIDSGTVTHVIVLEGNPAYTAPADLAVGEHLRRVPFSLHLGYGVDETARACSWHLPMRHVLESWGDTVTFDGTVALQQPVTAPLTEALAPIELMAAVLGEPQAGMALVQETWRSRWAGDFEQRWQVSLEAGVVEGSGQPPFYVRLRENWAAGIGRTGVRPGIALHFAPDPSTWDGRFAGNAWLQELPKPLTKQVWGNAALIAAETATRLGLASGDVVILAAGPDSIEAPVQIVAGQSADTMTLPLGYGRASAGPVGSHVGFDAYRLRRSTSPWALTGATLVATGRTQRLVTTQHHHSMEGRDVVRIVDASAPALPVSTPMLGASLYPEAIYDGHAWGMSIDLDACFGCNACVVACQAENNVPVVGPQEVAAGREMHWLRIDRYHADELDRAEAYFQPVPCMHCERAPCEVVCPVNATVHSSEGLNDMVYNRCIGTRTCSNNCPYKVRRFNWFDYAAQEPGKTGAGLNPDVTIRPRGVMEKCTYCTQRISAARIAARIERRPIRDGEILTACQQACPTRAIVFGDINDPDAAVSERKREPRNYALLGELNTKPRTTYLARVSLPGRAADEDK